MNPVKRLGTGRSSTFVDNPGSSALEFIQKIDLVGDATDVTFNGLDGDADVLYYLSYSAKVGSGGASELSLRPNGVSVNLSGTFSQATGVVVATATRAFMLIGVTDAVDGLGEGGVYFRATTGKKRLCFGQFARSTDTAPLLYIDAFSGKWDDSADNVTSLVIHCETVANGMGAGSTFSLYKMRNG